MKPLHIVLAVILVGALLYTGIKEMTIIDYNYVTSCNLCSETDTGMDSAHKGVTTCDARTYTDYCTALGTEEREYSCEHGGKYGPGYWVEVTKVGANYGQTCVDGALIKSTDTIKGTTTTTTAPGIDKTTTTLGTSDGTNPSTSSSKNILMAALAAMIIVLIVILKRK